MPPAFIIKGGIPSLGSIYQYLSFSEYIASLPLVFLTCLSVMPRFTRRSAAKPADDDTQEPSFDPLLSLQSSTEFNVLSSSVTTRSLTHFILASGLSNTLYDWTVVTLYESSTLRFVLTPYESRYP